ncbi:MAG: hypothetical protein ACRD1R_12265 [Acidobacteriota bacterium]
MQFLQGGVVEAFDGNVKVRFKGLKKSDSVGKMDEQRQRSGREKVVKRGTGANDLDLRFERG